MKINSIKNIAVIGGDMRNYYLCRSLANKNFNVKWIYAENFDRKECNFCNDDSFLSDAEAVIMPLPLTLDCETLNAPFGEKKIYLCEFIKKIENLLVFTSDDRVSGINYFKNESVTVDNARLTAVGFLKELLMFETEDILRKKALVTGFGRVSQAVCRILSANGVEVSVAARNESQRHCAKTNGYCAYDIDDATKKLSKYDYVINTVPLTLFSSEDIKNAGEKTAFFELASALIDKSKYTPKAYIECKGMPGKHTPESAGRVIADFIESYCKAADKESFRGAII